MSDQVEMVTDQEVTGKEDAETVAVEQAAAAPLADATGASEATQEPAAASPAESEPVGEAPVAEAAVDETPAVEEPVAAEPAAEPVAAAPVAEEASGEEDASQAAGRKVRVLSVGMQVEGTVKRIADFGAFVDIGVGRDGLIHVSELSVRRVGKVTDVLSEGQPITAWIKKLDRERNRISLTLVDPNTKTIRDLEQGEIVHGTVTRIMPYGAFVDIGIGRDALLHVREMSEGYVAKPEDVVKVGETLEARIIELSRRRGRVDLSLKGLRAEPEPPAPAPAPAQQPAQSSRAQEPEREPEPEAQDDYAEIETLSPMEAAFKRAMEAEGMEFKVNRKKQGKRNRRERDYDLQDDIISRTLSSGRK